MTVLREDTYSRRGVVRTRRRGSGALAIALLFVAFALVVLSRLEHPYVKALREAISPWTSRVLTTVSEPLAPIRESYARYLRLWSLQDEVKRLRAENQELRGWQWRARQLELRIAELSRSARAVADRKVPFVTARVVAFSSGPFARSAIIDTGRERLLRVGYPVVDADGLVGRLVEVGDGFARVLLINDVNSRIPVSIGDNQNRALGQGNNGELLKIRHLPRGAEMKVGDDVATSGVDGLFPQGLRIGKVVRAAKRLVIKPASNLDGLTYVSVLFHVSPVQKLTETLASKTASAPPPRARQTRGDQP